MKRSSFLSALCFWLAGTAILCGTGWVAYKWGYLQGLIDSHTAAFSAPASVALLDGILPLLAAVVLLGIGCFFRKRKSSF